MSQSARSTGRTVDALREFARQIERAGPYAYSAASASALRITADMIKDLQDQIDAVTQELKEYKGRRSPAS